MCVLVNVCFGQFRPNFHVVGDVPREPFLHLYVADRIHIRNLVADFLQVKCNLTENVRFAFLRPPSPGG